MTKSFLIPPSAAEAGVYQRQPREILSQLADAAVIVAPNRRIEWMNAAAESMFGRTLGQVQGELCSTIFAEYTVIPDKRGTGARGGTGSKSVVTCRRGDARLFPGEVTQGEIAGSDGERGAAFYVIRDLSQEREIEAILRALHLITASNGLDSAEKIYRILEIGCTRFGLETGRVCLIENGRCTILLETSNAPDVEPGKVVPLDGTPCADTFVAESPVAVGDLRKSGAYPLTDTGAYLGTSLIVDGERFGTLSFCSSVPRAPYAEFDLDLIKLLGAWTTQEVSRARFLDSLRNEAETDPLTGLSNRRAWMAQAESELFACRRGKRTAAIAILDLDRFKSVNDRFGHPAGDAVLRRVARLLRDECRPSDVIARIGGEEFAILLPGTDRNGAEIVAERLLQRLRDSTIVTAGAELKLTASIGAMAYADALPGVDSWYQLADRAVYAAKTAGRDCIRLGDLPDAEGATDTPAPPPPSPAISGTEQRI